MRLRIIFSLICLLSAGALGLSAQDKLKIGEFFEPSFQEKTGVTAVSIDGNVFEQFGNLVSRFRSLKVKDHKDIAKIEKAVKLDAAQAQKRTFSMSDGLLLYGYYVFTPEKGNLNRYVIYVHRPDSPALLIYMEGRIQPIAFERFILEKYVPSTDELAKYTD